MKADTASFTLRITLILNVDEGNVDAFLTNTEDEIEELLNPTDDGYNLILILILTFSVNIVQYYSDPSKYRT